MAVNKSSIFRFDDVEVREREFSLSKAGKVLTVEPKAFRALLFLLHNPQRLISKEELLNSVWGDAAVTEGSLTRCIWLLRSVLGDDIRSPRYIETVATVGYRFICKVEVAEEASGEPKATEAPNDLSGVAKKVGGEEIAALKEALSTGDLSGVAKKVGSRKRLWIWALAGGGVLALCMAAAIWYLHRPLPPPRVTGYTQITHDGHQKSLAGADGSRLYFNLMANPLSPGSVAEVAISGGEVAQIPIALPTPNLVDVSPDGSNLLIISVPEGDKPANPLWNVRTLGGSVRRLGEALGAAFSPDANSVVYSTHESKDQGDIYVVRSDGTGARKLASVGGDVYDLAWSPDGGVIRFSLDGKIWEMSSNGSGLHSVLPDWRPPSGQCCSHWTPDGKFVFLSSGGEIWALDERRGLFRRTPAKPVQLTSGPISWGIPIPSKDGTKIFAEGAILRGELSRFDSKSKQFQPFLGGISAQGVSFSNDGKSVAYVSYPESILWKANRDGSNPVRLSDPPIEAFLPRWSPDGKQIAFSDISSLEHLTNYIVSSDGGSPRKLLPEDNNPQMFPFWSPDGHKIAFTWQPASEPWFTTKIEVRILDLDSHQVTRVPESGGMLGPRWSPDGRYLVAGTRDELHLKIFDLKTRQWSELVQNGLADSGEWSRDGQFIYFRRPRGDMGVFRIGIHGGNVEKIADLKDWLDAGWWGKYMGLDPSDAPLLLRDIGSDDIYALTLEQK